MSETLEAIFDGHQVGTLSYAKDGLLFTYSDTWLANPSAFPLSLSMPMVGEEYPDQVVRSFISGLLPDDMDVLKRWGRKFQVSPQNPFRLLANVGEECAGAIQFIPPENLPDWQSDSPPHGVDWLSQSELEDRIDRLVADRSEARRHGDEGQFSLPGAQAKTGLFFDEENKRWGIPKGATPTTHILKPNVGEFEDFEINEHYCLRLGAQLGLRTAESWTETIGQHRVIVVTRYDRINLNGRLVRVHQEDFCQALGVKPEDKYQKDGGPSAGDVFALLRDYSSDAREDTHSFLRVLIFNYLIAGTDGHAKNYGLLISSQGQFRLTPLYDIISMLPYPHQPRKLKLAMKVGGEYSLWKINRERWENAAKEWGFDVHLVIDQIQQMASALPDAAEAAHAEVAELLGLDSSILERLHVEISNRARTCLAEFSG